MQYGARWSKEWHEDITHIVVDNDLVYGDVLKAAGVTEIPVRFTFRSADTP